MRLIQAPSKKKIGKDELCLFLAGTISGAVNWQDRMVKALKKYPITIINPRRKGDLSKTGPEARKQIAWEFERLRRANAISFYFSSETMAPITLFELGRYSVTQDRLNQAEIFVGIHPEYPRRFDVEVQMGLVGIYPSNSLEALIENVKKWLTDNYPEV